MSARILIITNGHLCRNPRTEKEARTLGLAGYDVTVLHVCNHAPSQILDDRLASGAPFRREVVNLLRQGGWPALRRRLTGWLARQTTGRFGWQSLGALGPAGSLLRRARQLPADLTIVHNEVAHGVGLRLHAAGRLVSADIEDWHSEDLLPVDRRQRPLALLRAQEKALLRDLVHTTTTSHALADGLQARNGGKRPSVIANSFPLQPKPRNFRAAGDDAPTFFWFSQRLGPGRGLEAVLAAWRDTTLPSRVVLVGDPQVGYREQLLESLPVDRRPFVLFRDCVPPADLPALIAEHDIGLALEQSTIPSRDLTITNKILQYLNAGLAVVASDTAGQREVLARAPEAGLLVSLHQTAAFTMALTSLLTDRAALSRRQHLARRLAEEVYCWEKEAPRLIPLVEAALASRQTRGSV